MSDVGQKLAQALRSKIQEDERNTRCGRIDLELADYRRVGPHNHEILVEYSRDRGAPSMSQLGEWTMATFNGAFRLNLATVYDHAELSVMRCHIQENQAPMLMRRSASMIRLGGGRFLDQHKNQWEVQKAANGEDILVRSSDIKVEDILEERINRQRSGRYARVAFAQIKTAGVANLEVGDTVLYGEPAGGQLQKTGVLGSVSTDNVQIRGREGSLSRSYVIDVVNKSSSSKAAENKMLVDFFTEYLFAGDRSMGKQLTIK